jgi:hypothetical protein
MTDEEKIDLLKMRCSESGRQIETLLTAIGSVRSKMVSRASDAETLSEVKHLYDSLSDLQACLRDLLYV